MLSLENQLLDLEGRGDSRLARELFDRPSMLIIAHPGHELRVYGWMRRASTTVQIITDGGGRDGAARTDASARLIERLGVQAGRVFGQLSDRDAYEAMMRSDAAVFVAMLEQLAEEVRIHAPAYVIGDSAEGYNPSHDLCRAMIDCLVILCRKRWGRRLDNYAFDLTEWRRPAAPVSDSFEIDLPADEHREKIQACRDYPGLRAETDVALTSVGEGHFQREQIWRAPAGGLALPQRPHYEDVGDARVSAGVYQQTIRFADHVRPIAAALRAHALKG